MKSQKEEIYCLYKIYSENCLLYVGSTKASLMSTLHEHFFKENQKKPINLACVTKIEYAFLPSEADLLVAEAYYVNKLKPALNMEAKAQDQLHIEMPALRFQAFQCETLSKWKEDIQNANKQNEEWCRLCFQIEKERQEKLCEIFALSGLTDEDKQKIYEEWLRNFYEPIRNGLL